MSRALATVAEIAGFRPIDGADRIQLAQLVDRAWEVIVTKDYAVGQRGVYFEPDAFLPEQPQYEMLRARCFRECQGKRGFRLRTIKLRGVYSQGLFLPLDALPVELPAAAALELGRDVTQLLGVEQWPEEEGGGGGESRRTFPSFVPRSNQPRVENLGKRYAELQALGDYLWTEKLDGSSFTAYVRGGEFGYCSRNFLLSAGEAPPTAAKESAYAAVVRRYELEAKLRALGRDVALQGEVIGPRLQGNRYKRTDSELYVFVLWDIAAQRRLPLAALRELGLDLLTVPIVEQRPLPSIAELRAAADGASQLHRAALREGLVLYCAADPMQSFKVISRQFLAKQ